MTKKILSTGFEEHPLYAKLLLFVNSSEESSTWYELNWDKIHLIVDGIEIDGLQFDVADLQHLPNGKDVWKHDRFTYFSFDAANRCAKEQGKRLPTKDEWKHLVEFLPKTIENKILFLKNVMGFSFSGFHCWDNSFFCNFGDDCGYWSSTGSATHAYNLYFKEGFIDYNDFDFKNIGFPIRCLKN